MHWLTKHSPTKNGLYERKFVVIMLGVIGLCCSLSALADPLYVPEADATDALSDSNTNAISDSDLSFITGKGGVSEGIENNSLLAVILWDEGGSVKRRSANHAFDGDQNLVSSSKNLQTVTLIINGK